MSHRIVIDAKRNSLFINFKELWDYRDLLGVLAYRDLRVRYAQTSLGLIWALLQPLATLLIFIAVFQKGLGAKAPDGVDYALFTAVGLAAWTYFAIVLKEAGSSIITSSNMVKKVFFPRIIIPLSKALAAFVEWGVAMVFVVVLMIYFGYPPSVNIVFLPFVLLLTIITALGFGIWVSALTIRFRDFQHVVPFAIQFGLYATPIGYSLKDKITNPTVLTLFYLNPMVTIVDAYRWSILGVGNFDIFSSYNLMAIGLIFVVFTSGLAYFRSVEIVMADYV